MLLPLYALLQTSFFFDNIRHCNTIVYFADNIVYFRQFSVNKMKLHQPQNHHRDCQSEASEHCNQPWQHGKKHALSHGFLFLFGVGFTDFLFRICAAGVIVFSRRSADAVHRSHGHAVVPIFALVFPFHFVNLCQICPLTCNGCDRNPDKRFPAWLRSVVVKIFFFSH